jgi:hypothetical protein
MEQLTETLFSPLQLTEQDERGYYHAQLLCTRGDYVNGNGRVYPMGVWEREIPKAKELITQGRFIGLADHPGPSLFGAGASIANTVIKFDDLRIEGREVWGDVTIIPTSKGRDIIEIAKAGVQIGASTRGRGSVSETEEYTDPDGVLHQNVSVVDEESYKFDAVDLVLQPSVGDAGMYRFEQLNDEDMEQIQGVLFAEIEEKVSESYLNKIQELEELLGAAEEHTKAMEVEMEEMEAGAKEVREELETLIPLTQELTESGKELSEERDTLAGKLSEVQEELESTQGDLGTMTSRYDALTHLISKVKGEKFSALLIEQLKDCPTVEAVDENYDSALATVMTLVAGSPSPSGKAVIHPQRTDLDSDVQEKQEYPDTPGATELSEEDKEQARRIRRMHARAGLDLLE